MSKLLINERPMILLPSLAEKIGHEQAIVLQQIQYWLDRHEEIGNERTFRRDKWWVYNTVEEWQRKQFVWWSVSTLKRILQTLEKMGLIITERFEKSDWNQRKWYSIDYGAIENLEETKLEGWKLSREDLIEAVAKIASNPCNSGMGQIDPISGCNLVQSEGSICANDLYTETTNRDYSQRLHKQSIKQSDNGVSEKTPDSRDSFIQEEISQQQTGKTDSYSTVEHQSGYLNAGDGENSGQDHGGGFSLKKEKRERKRRIAYTYDDWGYIVLPVKGHTKLAAALALRTMQFRLAEEIGCEFYVEDGEVWVNDGKASYELTEQAAFGKSDEDNEDEDRAHLPMGKLRGISGISPESYNMQVMEWFKEWMGWCKQYGKRAASILSKYSVIQIMDVVDYDDYDEETA